MIGLKRITDDTPYQDPTKLAVMEFPYQLDKDVWTAKRLLNLPKCFSVDGVKYFGEVHNYYEQCNIPVYFVWLKYLSWFKLANEVMMVNQWQNVHNITCNAAVSNTTFPPMSDPCLYKTGDDVLNYTGFDKDNVLMDILLLVALQVGFRLLSLVALIVRARRSKE
ncbi:protein white-like [Elysia marginata]|uniref:Protein white-like n=1 Tax=Elysia marginata TaxID=1093978 RepID=A0AAV4HJC1_9GAST|nr:protein white-like [Elysia marginata]